MQHREDTSVQTGSTKVIAPLEDGRKAYEVPTFKKLASSETQVGTTVSPDATSLS